MHGHTLVYIGCLKMWILYKIYKHCYGGAHLPLTLGGNDDTRRMADGVSGPYSFLFVSVAELLNVNA